MLLVAGPLIDPSSKQINLSPRQRFTMFGRRHDLRFVTRLNAAH